jgi:hypothetical protein
MDIGVRGTWLNGTASLLSLGVHSARSRMFTYVLGITYYPALL